MKFLNKRFSVNGPQTTAMACEACVYGRGEHKEFCREAKNDPAVGSPATDADLDLLRAQVGATAESPVSGAGTGPGAQVPEVREPVWHEFKDYVPAVGGCGCGGNNG